MAHVGVESLFATCTRCGSKLAKLTADALAATRGVRDRDTRRARMRAIVRVCAKSTRHEWVIPGGKQPTGPFHRERKVA